MVVFQFPIFISSIMVHIILGKRSKVIGLQP